MWPLNRQKGSWAWRHVPLYSITWEVEADESGIQGRPELGCISSSRSAWATWDPDMFPPSLSPFFPPSHRAEGERWDISLPVETAGLDYMCSIEVENRKLSLLSFLLLLLKDSPWNCVGRCWHTIRSTLHQQRSHRREGCWFSLVPDFQGLVYGPVAAWLLSWIDFKSL